VAEQADRAAGGVEAGAPGDPVGADEFKYELEEQPLRKLGPWRGRLKTMLAALLEQDHLKKTCTRPAARHDMEGCGGRTDRLAAPEAELLPHVLQKLPLAPHHLNSCRGPQAISRTRTGSCVLGTREAVEVQLEASRSPFQLPTERYSARADGRRRVGADAAPVLLQAVVLASDRDDGGRDRLSDPF
jgi:hypothetical protein